MFWHLIFWLSLSLCPEAYRHIILASFYCTLILLNPCLNPISFAPNLSTMTKWILNSTLSFLLICRRFLLPLSTLRLSLCACVFFKDKESTICVCVYFCRIRRQSQSENRRWQGKRAAGGFGTMRWKLCDSCKNRTNLAFGLSSPCISPCGGVNLRLLNCLPPHPPSP